jgi:hypothetical protein
MQNAKARPHYKATKMHSPTGSMQKTIQKNALVVKFKPLAQACGSIF